MDDSNIGTRDRIIEVSRKLFSVGGFEGTSIRDIAKDANVNIAAVNYHFKNKENLFSYLLRDNYQRLVDKIISMDKEDNWNVENFILRYFDYLTKEDPINMPLGYRIFLTPYVKAPTVLAEANLYGVPGASVFLNIVSREIGDSVSAFHKEWASEMIVDYVNYNALIYISFFKRDDTAAKSHPEYAKIYENLEERFQLRITRFAKAILNEILR